MTDAIECPHCGETQLLEFGVGRKYGMELEFWTCFICGTVFGGDLDDQGYDSPW